MPDVELLVDGARDDLEPAVAVEVAEGGRRTDALAARGVRDLGVRRVLVAARAVVRRHREAGADAGVRVPAVNLPVAGPDDDLLLPVAVEVGDRHAADHGRVRDRHLAVGGVAVEGR